MTNSFGGGEIRVTGNNYHVSGGSCFAEYVDIREVLKRIFFIKRIIFLLLLLGTTVFVSFVDKLTDQQVDRYSIFLFYFFKSIILCRINLMGHQRRQKEGFFYMLLQILVCFRYCSLMMFHCQLGCLDSELFSQQQVYNSHCMRWSIVRVVLHRSWLVFFDFFFFSRKFQKNLKNSFTIGLILIQRFSFNKHAMKEITIGLFEMK